MARSAITVASGSYDGIVATNNGTTIDATNGNYIATDGNQSRIVLLINHSTSVSRTMAVKAGTNPPAFRATADVTLTLNASNASPIMFVGPFESAQHFQSAAAGTSTAAGDILLDFQTGTTGTIYAYKLPLGGGR